MIPKLLEAVFLQSQKLIDVILSGTPSPEDSAAASTGNSSDGGQVCAFVSSVLLWSLGAISLTFLKVCCVCNQCVLRRTNASHFGEERKIIDVIGSVLFRHDKEK